MPETDYVFANDKLSPAELDEWFEQQEFPSAVDVSEGELRFISTVPDKPVLHSINKLIITPVSLDNGWVSLSQCYQHLDPVAVSEVVYQYKSMQDLTIIRYTNIEKAKVKGQTIELSGVQKNAELCISARVRIFYQNTNGTYSLVNGPFHRKFLDGYYPYHLTLEVQYPDERLQVLQTIPVAQPGMTVNINEGYLLFDGVFEGILNVEVIFQPKN